MSDGESLDQFAELSSGIRICFRDHGAKTNPAILLVAGLGEDLTFWGESFVGSLVAHGYRVITMDNRDVGRSTFVATKPPAIWRQVLARPRKDAYSLSDMAADCLGVLDHLGIEKVHLVGRSMGGMIAQTIAATEPTRVLSLTSLYSTTGARKVGQPAKSTIRIIALATVPKTREAFVRSHIKLTRHIAGTEYPIDEAEESAIAGGGWDRKAGDLTAGGARQIEAIQRSGDRTAQLAAIVAPTLIINGDRDLLVAPSGGAATAKAIRSAQQIVIPGMGHHTPEALVDPITRHISHHARRVSNGGRNHVEAS